MKRRLLISTLVLAPMALSLSTASHAAYVSRATVNPDRSVTIDWALASTEVSNTSVAVDCCVVHTWYTVDRSTSFTTAPLPAGRHTITLEVLEMTWTNTDYGPSNCKVSPRPAYRWVCTWRRWTTVTVRVPASSAPAGCVVPQVKDLRIADAKARIKLAGCALGTVTHKGAARPSGIVLTQRPRPGTHIPTGSAITLVVSKGPASA